MKIGHVKVEDIFAAIDWCLKNTFPENYDARCLYNACAIHTLLKREGIKSVIVGGSAGAFTLSVDGREALLEGFGGGDATRPSHYWVEANGIILDPGTSYLPRRSRMHALQMPMVAWKKRGALPKYIQYVEKIRYAEGAEYIFPDEIAERVAVFIDCCEKRYASKVVNKKLSTWILSSSEKLNNAAKSGDRWAIGALRFQAMESAPKIPD